MKNKRIPALLAAGLILTSCFYSCGDKEENKENKTPSGSETVENDGLALPKDLRFDGETFDMYLALPTVKRSYIAAEETGDLINDAVYARNNLVEDRLGVKLNIVATDRTSSGSDQTLESNNIKTLIQSGDDTYEAFIHVQHGAMPGFITEGLFVDWNELKYVDINNPWWFSNVARDISFGGKVYCMTGDYNFNSYASTACLAFNKTLCDELELEYPYQMVFDGTWTHDKFVEYIKKATKDIDGNGTITKEQDRYGYMGWQPETYVDLFCGYGSEVISKDDLNLPVLGINNERNFTVIDKMLEVFDNEGAYVEATTYGFDDKTFAEGRLLFNDSFLSSMPEMRGYENIDVGFVPYPKLDEQQEEYYSRTAAISGLTYIPVTNEKLDMTGAVLEAMAYYSTDTIIDTYFDIILTVKSTRDVESEQMIPIIRNSSRFMEQIINFTGGNIVVAKQGNTLSSFIAAHSDAWQVKIDDLREFYEE